MNKSVNGSLPIPNSVTVIRNDTTFPLIKDWSVPIVNLEQRLKDRYINGYLLVSLEILFEHSYYFLLFSQDNAKKLAMCVGILFKFQPWLTILQLIEFHRWQGAEKFYFFYRKVDSSIYDLFEYYDKHFPGLVQHNKWLPTHYACLNDVNYEYFSYLLIRLF